MSRLDDAQQRHGWLGLPFAIYQKFVDDKAVGLASMLSYYAFASFVPLLLVLVSALGFLSFGRSSIDFAAVAEALRSIPFVGDDLANRRLKGSLPVLLVGSAVTLLSSIGVAQQAQVAFNSIYTIPRRDWPTYGARALRSVVATVVGGPGFVLAVLISAALVGRAGHLPALPVGLRVLAGSVLLVVNAAIHLLVFGLLTAERPRHRVTWPGALLAGLGWSVVQVIAAWAAGYKLAEADPFYRTFAVVIGLLVLFHILALVTLAGAEINVVRAHRLWPRGLLSIVRLPTTEADRRCYRAYVRRGLYADSRYDHSFVVFDEGVQPSSAGPQGGVRDRSPGEPSG